MKYFLSVLIIIFFTSCSIKNNTSTAFSNIKKIQNLKKQLLSLSPTVSEQQSFNLSKLLIIKSKALALSYELNSFALYHNFLINLKIKKRGYCYHYAKDLLKEIKKQDFSSFVFYWAVHKRGEYFEHNALVVSSKNSTFEEGIIIDAWRNEGELFFKKVKNDKKYIWKKHHLKSKYYTLKK